MQVILANIMAIYRRELQSYFASPLAYAIACVFWIISGLFFVYILLDPQQGLIAQVAIRDKQLANSAPPVDLPYTFQQLFLGNVMSSLALFVLPMLSMGLYAEDHLVMILHNESGGALIVQFKGKGQISLIKTWALGEESRQ